MQIPFEKDEWEDWRDHPITAWLFDSFLTNEIEATKQEFVSYAWGKAGNDPVKHASLFERANVLKDLVTLTYDDIEAKNTDE